MARRTDKKELPQPLNVLNGVLFRHWKTNSLSLPGVIYQGERPQRLCAPALAEAAQAQANSLGSLVHLL